MKSDSEKFSFTPEEVSVIDKNLGFIVFDWAKHLVSHIVSQARKNGAKSVYINSSETLNSGATEGKVQFFYEKFPPTLGFKEEMVDLRGKGKERLWAMHFAQITSNESNFLVKIAQRTFTLEEIPSKYQGAVLSIVGKKPSYSLEDIRKIINIVEKRKPKGKSIPKYYYDWSKEWSGAQRFHDNITESVVLQKIPHETQEFINNNPVLTKFWAYILSQSQHFGADVMGFALISKISSDIWLINEIQTDCINSYLKLRASLYKDKVDQGNKLSWDTVKDLLEAGNKSNWIAILEGNEPVKQQIIDNPNIIEQLPDNSQNIQQWIEKQKAETQQMGATRGLDLMRHFQSVDFNSKIFRIY